MNDASPHDADTTAWFDAGTTPVREGVYERRIPHRPFSCWNGRAWNDDASTPTDAAGRSRPSAEQRVSWRGLVEPSGLPCATCKGHTVVDRGYDAEIDRDLIAECPDC